MTVAAYYRSSLDKKKQVHSIDLQKGIVQEQASKNLIVIDEEYVDEGVSAKKNDIQDRPALSRLLKNIREGKVTSLFVYKRDRLARNVTQYLEIYELFKEKNLQVHFCAANEISLQFSPAGEFFELVMAGFNQREAEQIVQRITETKASLTRAGKHSSGSPPYGYTTDESNNYVPIDDEIETIKHVFNQLLCTKANTFPEFQRDLNQKGILCKGKEWDYGVLKNLIKRLFYKGVIRKKFEHEIIEVYRPWLEIIPEAEWDRAQEILDSLIQKRERLSNKVDFLLNDLLYCHDCVQKINGGAKRDSLGTIQGYYRCKKHYRNASSQFILETKVIESAQSFFEQISTSHLGKMIEEFQKGTEKDALNDLQTIEKQIHQCEKSIVKISDRWLQEKSHTSRDKMVETYEQLKVYKKVQKFLESRYEEAKLLPERIRQLHDKGSIDVSISHLPFERKKELLYDLINRILLSRNQVVVVFKHPFFTGFEEVSEFELT
jgi:site-specific DNA recombinase